MSKIVLDFITIWSWVYCIFIYPVFILFEFKEYNKCNNYLKPRYRFQFLDKKRFVYLLAAILWLIAVKINKQ